jgi:hypothetical protein
MVIDAGDALISAINGSAPEDVVAKHAASPVGMSCSIFWTEPRNWQVSVV